MDLNTVITVLNENSGAIDAIAIVILVIVTICYAGLTYKIVKIEEKREKDKERKILNILLAEFKGNKDLLERQKNEVADFKSNRDLWKPPEKGVLPGGGSYESYIFPPIDFRFLGFREDGWNTFRNQGGSQYIEESLYDKIAKHYVSLYITTKEREILTDSREEPDKIPDDFCNRLITRITEIEKEHDILQMEIKRILDKTV